MNAQSSEWTCGCGHGEHMHNVNGCFRKNGHDEYCACPCVPPAIAEKQRDFRRAWAKRCTEHPKYRALRRPRLACEGCWRMWIQVNP